MQGIISSAGEDSGANLNLSSSFRNKSNDEKETPSYLKMTINATESIRTIKKIKNNKKSPRKKSALKKSKINKKYSNTNKSILENWRFDNLNSYTQMYRGWRKEIIRILSIIDQLSKEI